MREMKELPPHPPHVRLESTGLTLLPRTLEWSVEPRGPTLLLFAVPSRQQRGLTRCLSGIGVPLTTVLPDPGSLLCLSGPGSGGAQGGIVRPAVSRQGLCWDLK